MPFFNPNWFYQICQLTIINQLNIFLKVFDEICINWLNFCYRSHLYLVSIYNSHHPYFIMLILEFVFEDNGKVTVHIWVMVSNSTKFCKRANATIAAPLPPCFRNLHCVACLLEYATDLYINSLSCFFLESESAVSTRSTRQQRYLARNQPRASTLTHTWMDIDASPVLPQSPSNPPSTSAQNPLQPVNIPSTSTPLTGMRT